MADNPQQLLQTTARTGATVNTTRQGYTTEYPDSAGFEKKKFSELDGAIASCLYLPIPAADDERPVEPAEDKPRGTPEEVPVEVKRVDVGYGGNWTHVRGIDGLEFYTLTSNITFIEKKIFPPKKKRKAKKQIRIIPIRERLVNQPFKNEERDLYSVRVPIDWENTLDKGSFNNAMNDAFCAGVSQLLIYSGKFVKDPSDQFALGAILTKDGKPGPYGINCDLIEQLQRNYHNFAFIENDLDETIKSDCDRITFTVSIPIEFFDNFPAPQVVEQDIPSSDFTLKFNNRQFFENLDALLNIINNQRDKIKEAQFPNKILVNYITDTELNLLVKFSLDLNEIFNNIEYPLRSQEIHEYEFGFKKTFSETNGNSLEIVSLKVGKRGEESRYVSQDFIRKILNSRVNEPRIFNYFININSIKEEWSRISIENYMEKFVDFPKAFFDEERVRLGVITYTPEELEEFRLYSANKEESCSNLSDFLSIGKDASKAVVDSVKVTENFKYHFLRADDVQKEDTSFKSAFNTLKDNRGIVERLNDADSKLKENEPMNVFFGAVENFVVKQGVDPIVEATADAFSNGGLKGISNTLCYFISRLDVQELIMKKIICLLKSGNPLDPEIARILQSLPEDLVQFFNYLHNLSLLSNDAIKFTEALLGGLPFDIKLTCNPQTAYFLKGMREFIRKWGAVNTAAQSTIQFVHSLDAQARLIDEKNPLASKQIRNPWSLIISSMGKTFWQVLIDFVFDTVKILLTTECDDSEYYGNTRDISDPFRTYTSPAYQTLTEAEKEEARKRDIAEAGRESIPDILTRMGNLNEIDYTIDLIEMLLEDVKCLLPPRRSLGLLCGDSEIEDITVIKNLILTKYSTPPNDLTFLLHGDNIILFFKKLGRRINPEACKQIQEFVVPRYSNNVCEPEISYAREQLLNKKLPKELGVLKNANAKRVQQIKSAIQDLIKGERVVTFSALCPDIEDEDILKARQQIIEDQKNTIRTLFADVLATFNKEIEQYPDNLLEEKTLFRQNSEDKFYETADFSGLETNIYKNLADGRNFYDIEESIQTLPIDDTNEYITFDKTLIQKYVYKDRILNPSSIGKAIYDPNSNIERIDDSNECSEKEVSLSDQEYVTQLFKEGRVIITDARMYKEDFQKFEFGGMGGEHQLFKDLQDHETRRTQIKTFVREGKKATPSKLHKDACWNAYRTLSVNYELGNDLVGYTPKQLEELIKLGEKEKELGSLNSSFPPVGGKRYTVRDYYLNTYNESLTYTSNFSKLINPSLEQYIKIKGYVILIFVNEDPDFLDSLGQIDKWGSFFLNGNTRCRPFFSARMVFYDVEYGDFRDIDIKTILRDSQKVKDNNFDKDTSVEGDTEFTEEYLDIKNFCLLVNKLVREKNTNYLQSMGDLDAGKLAEELRKKAEQFNDPTAHEIHRERINRLVNENKNIFFNDGELSFEDSPTVARRYTYGAELFLKNKYYNITIEEKNPKTTGYYPKVANDSWERSPVQEISWDRHNAFQTESSWWTGTISAVAGAATAAAIIAFTGGFASVGALNAVYWLLGSTTGSGVLGGLTYNIISYTATPNINPNKDASRWYILKEFNLADKIPEVVSQGLDYSTVTNFTNNVLTFLNDILYNRVSLIRGAVESKNKFSSIYEIAKAFEAGGLFNISSSYFYDNTNKLFNSAKVLNIAKAGPPERVDSPVPTLRYEKYINYSYTIDVSNAFDDNIIDSINNMPAKIASLLTLGNNVETIEYVKNNTGITDPIMKQASYDRYFLKPSYDEGEIYLVKKEVEWWRALSMIAGVASQDAPVTDVESIYGYLDDKTYSVVKGTTWKNVPYLNYKRIANLNYRFPSILGANLSCPLRPHYLNLEKFLETTGKKAAITLCDDNISNNFGKMIDEIIVNLTIRTYITDFMTRVLPLLHLLDVGTLRSLHREEVLITLFRKLLQVEMSKFTEKYDINNPKNYYNMLTSKAINVFLEILGINESSQEEAANQTNYSNVSDLNRFGERAINFFISREIHHYINISIFKRVIIPARQNFWFDLELMHEHEQIYKNEFYAFFAYYIMHTTLDVKINNTLMGTKTILADLLFKTSHLSAGMDAEPNYDFPDLPSDDIIKTMSDVAYSPNPSMLILTKRDFRITKYIKFAITAMVENARQILLQTSIAQDPNIKLTRIWNFVLATASSLTYSFIDKEAWDKNLISILRKTDFNTPGFSPERAGNTLALLGLKRIEAGKAPIPDIITSLGVLVTTKIPPLPIGWQYLALDTIQEAEWSGNTINELYTLKQSLESIQADQQVKCDEDLKITPEDLCAKLTFPPDDDGPTPFCPECAIDSCGRHISDPCVTFDKEGGKIIFKECITESQSCDPSKEICDTDIWCDELAKEDCYEDTETSQPVIPYGNDTVPMQLEPSEEDGEEIEGVEVQPDPSDEDFQENTSALAMRKINKTTLPPKTTTVAKNTNCNIPDCLPDGIIAKCYTLSEPGTYYYTDCSCPTPVKKAIVLSRTRKCGEEVDYASIGGYSYGTIIPVKIGKNVTNITFNFETYMAPDRFIIEYNGINIYDTGYVGFNRYQFSGGRRDEFTKSLVGKIDPITNRPYPYNASDTSQDGYPKVYSNIPKSVDLVLDGSSDFLLVKVYAPMDSTRWNFRFGGVFNFGCQDVQITNFEYEICALGESGVIYESGVDNTSGIPGNGAVAVEPSTEQGRPPAAGTPTTTPQPSGKPTDIQQIEPTPPDSLKPNIPTDYFDVLDGGDILANQPHILTALYPDNIPLEVIAGEDTTHTEVDVTDIWEPPADDWGYPYPDNNRPDYGYPSGGDPNPESSVEDTTVTEDKRDEDGYYPDPDKRYIWPPGQVETIFTKDVLNIDPTGGIWTRDYDPVPPDTGTPTDTDVPTGDKPSPKPDPYLTTAGGDPGITGIQEVPDYYGEKTPEDSEPPPDLPGDDRDYDGTTDQCKQIYYTIHSLNEEIYGKSDRNRLYPSFIKNLHGMISGMPDHTLFERAKINNVNLVTSWFTRKLENGEKRFTLRTDVRNKIKHRCALTSSGLSWIPFSSCNIEHLLWTLASKEKTLLPGRTRNISVVDRRSYIENSGAIEGIPPTISNNGIYDSSKILLNTRYSNDSKYFFNSISHSGTGINKKRKVIGFYYSGVYLNLDINVHTISQMFIIPKFREYTSGDRWNNVSLPYSARQKILMPYRIYDGTNSVDYIKAGIYSEEAHELGAEEYYGNRYYTTALDPAIWKSAANPNLNNTMKAIHSNIIIRNSAHYAVTPFSIQPIVRDNVGTTLLYDNILKTYRSSSGLFSMYYAFPRPLNMAEVSINHVFNTSTKGIAKKNENPILVDFNGDRVSPQMVFDPLIEFVYEKG